jgi:hypothetical protein
MVRMVPGGRLEAPKLRLPKGLVCTRDDATPAGGRSPGGLEKSGKRVSVTLRAMATA